MITTAPNRKFTPILPWRVLIPLATLASLWPHFGGVVVVVVFSLYLTLPFIALAFIVLFVMGGIGLWNGNKVYRRRSLQGFLVLSIIFTAPIFSTKTVDAYFRCRSVMIIENLDGYKSEHGYFPTTIPCGDSISAICGLEYVKLNELDGYVLKYRNGFLTLNKYYSTDRKWTTYGWND
jgi:hypothetical protein